MRAEWLKKIIIIIYYIIISYTEVYISCCLCDMYLEHNFMHKKIKCVILIHFPLKFKYFVCIALNQHYANFSIVIKTLNYENTLFSYWTGFNIISLYFDVIT